MSVDSTRKAFRTSDDCLISYEVRPAREATAPRLALIHPLALDGTVWHRVARHLDGKVSLLTYDCRGHGRSERRAMPFSVELFACDLVELMDHIEWPVATVVGCSMGGCVAQAFAGLYPRRLNALGLIDTTAWYGKDAPEKWRERARTARDSGLSSMIEFQEARWFSDAFRTRDPQTVARINEIFLANDVECYQATCIMLGDADLRPLSRETRVPTAIVVGEEDYATPVHMSEQLHESIPRSTLTVLDGVRHLAPVEAPEHIASAVWTLIERAV